MEHVVKHHLTTLKERLSSLNQSSNTESRVETAAVLSKHAHGIFKTVTGCRVKSVSDYGQA